MTLWDAKILGFSHSLGRLLPRRPSTPNGRSRPTPDIHPFCTSDCQAPTAEIREVNVSSYYTVHRNCPDASDDLVTGHLLDKDAQIRQHLREKGVFWRKVAVRRRTPYSRWTRHRPEVTARSAGRRYSFLG
jgi:hypothetical protein